MSNKIIGIPIFLCVSLIFEYSYYVIVISRNYFTLSLLRKENPIIVASTAGFHFIAIAILLPLAGYFCSSTTGSVVFLNCVEQDMIFLYNLKRLDKQWLN